jgi:signal peptidase I
MLKHHSRRTNSSRRNTTLREQAHAVGRYLWYRWIRPVAPVVLIVLTFRGAVADWNDVPTPSMSPTIEVGDRVFVNKLAYGLRVPLTHAWIAQWRGPQRGEIAVLFSPKDGKRLVKRVIGLPGDEIAMRNNCLYINGEAVEYELEAGGSSEQIVDGRRLRQVSATEHLGQHAHPVLGTPDLQAIRSFGPIRVPEDHYFVMGDNRDMSADSRLFGFVPRHLLVGRSGRVVLSFDPDNWYLPRLSRFWHRLP